MLTMLSRVEEERCGRGGGWRGGLPETFDEELYSRFQNSLEFAAMSSKSMNVDFLAFREIYTNNTITAYFT